MPLQADVLLQRYSTVSPRNPYYHRSDRIVQERIRRKQYTSERWVRFETALRQGVE